jgi:hypothetical protein
MAAIDIEPDTLNLESKGKDITCYIELPAGYNVSDINLSSMRLNGEVFAELNPTSIADYDNDGVPDIMVKFDRSAVQKLMEVGDSEKIVILFELYNGTIFGGTDFIRTIKN